MLRFDRPTFRSGVMVVKITLGETELGWSLRPQQKLTNVDFAVEGQDTAAIETALVAKYTPFLTVPV